MVNLTIINQEMNNTELVVRQRLEDLTTKSQLVVYESQEAIFFKNGQALDLFGSGRHELTTENLPLIKKLFSGIFGKKTPFPCDVFFVNKVSLLDFIWGTDSPIDLADPKYSMIVGVRANGQTTIRISDSRRFITKISGMLYEYTADTLKRAVKGLMIAPIKECIAQAIIEKGVSVLEITPRLTEISENIQQKLNAKIESLGITVENFSVNAILASDGDLDALKKAKSDMLAGMNEADIEAYKMEKLSMARARSRATEGCTYQEERRFDILEGAAKNDSTSGGLINMGVGLGVGAGVVKEVGSMTASITGVTASPTSNPASAVCSDCGETIPTGAKFCPNCGKARPVNRFCPECGTKAAEGAKFCAECGTKLI